MWEKVKAMEIQLNNIIGAIVVLLIGLIIGLIVKKLLRRILHEIELDKLVKRLGKNYSLEKKISNLAAYLIYFFALVWSLNQLGITPIVLYIIGGAVLLLLVATFLIGIKDFIPNLIAGIVINRRDPWKKGKKIKVNGVEGTVEKIGWLEMEIKTKKGDKIYMPNSLLVKSKVLSKR
ncbi:mechanosensitive ion channel [Candidatus Woesearchaeota archaeon]|nr:mechanosensitive ion channel [Candidatus Woesearchaeota archaeon]